MLSNTPGFFAKSIKNSSAVIAKLENIAYPMIIKPANLGSSVGITIAKIELLAQAIEVAQAFDRKIVVESITDMIRFVAVY